MLCAGLITFQFCWTFCMLRLCDMLYSYWVFQNVLYRIQNVQHVHHAFKNEKLLFLTSEPSINVKSPGCRIFFSSLQNDNLLSFQTLNSSSIPLNASWRDFLAGVNNGINAAIGSSSPECWIHVWYSVDPDTWKLVHRVDHTMLLEYHQQENR